MGFGGSVMRRRDDEDGLPIFKQSFVLDAGSIRPCLRDFRSSIVDALDLNTKTLGRLHLR